MGSQIQLAVGTGAAVIALVVATASAQTLPNEPTGVSAVPTPDAAVQEAVIVDTSAVYAGDCAVSSSPANLGEVCSWFVAQRATVRAYLAGRTFSEFDTWIFVKQTATGWVPDEMEPVDAMASPSDIPWPAT